MSHGPSTVHPKVITLCNTSWQRDSKGEKGIGNKHGNREVGRRKERVEVMWP